MIRNEWVPIAVAVAVATALGGLHAAAEEEAEEPSETAGGAKQVRELSLAEAVALGIANNLDVQVERHGPLLAREDLGVAWGAFDPTFSFAGGVADIKNPTSNVFQGTPTETSDRIYDGDGSISGLVPWLGGEYSVSYVGDSEQTTSTLSTLSPEFRSRVNLEIEVPLLKNLIWNEPWTEVRRGRISVAEDDEEFRTRLMDVVRGIEDAYWALIATKESRRVAAKSLETARALEELTRVQYEVGVVSQVEVTEAVAGVAEREVSSIRAEARYLNRQDELANQILGDRFSPLLDLTIEPTDSPDRIGIRDIDVGAATQVAFELRPELGVLRKSVEREELELRFARNQRLPEFNVRGTVGYEGLAGRENRNRLLLPGSPPIGTIPSPRPEFIDSTDDLFTDSSQQWSVRGILSIPLGNVSARHSFRRARFELGRAESRLRREQQVVIVEIRRAVRELKAALEGIEAAERRRLAAEEQLRAERLRLEYGESTPFDVLQRERDLVEAEEQKILSQQIYHNSVSGLARAQGTTLRARNIEISDVIN
jgi:outer membrane protein TolC